jgi:uncharacterized protein (UPF0335 family)
MDADAKLAAYVDRVLRMKEEADGIAEDIKAIYGEAKNEGYDKTQLGNLVTYLRKRAKDKDGEAEKEAVFDLYLSAYLRAKGEVGTVRATRAHAPDDDTPVQDAKVLMAEAVATAELEPEQGAQISRPGPTNLTPLTPKPLRPYCQNPGPKCGGQGKRHCWSCERAHNEAGAA